MLYGIFKILLYSCDEFNNFFPIFILWIKFWIFLFFIVVFLLTFILNLYKFLYLYIYPRNVFWINIIQEIVLHHLCIKTIFFKYFFWFSFSKYFSNFLFGLLFRLLYLIIFLFVIFLFLKELLLKFCWLIVVLLFS